MKVSLNIKEENISAQKENIDIVLGQTNEIALNKLDTLKINYKIDLGVQKDLLLRLRALVELSEHCEIISIEDLDTLREYSECVRLMQDLVTLAEAQKIDDWDEEEEAP